MKNMGKAYATGLSVLTAVMIAGCGSSSSDRWGGDTTVTYTNTVVDSVVANLAFECAPSGMGGVTNDEGQFTCESGDTATFKVGALTLGSWKVIGEGYEVTPYLLTGNQETPTTINIAQLVQSLDPNGPGDIIEIDANLSALFDNVSYEINSTTFDDEANATLGGKLISEAAALEHLHTNAPDTVPPVVTLNGVNFVEIKENTDYRDAGAQACDNVDGNITAELKMTSDVDPKTLGEYTVVWTVSDKAGNEGKAVRTVKVVENPPPVVTVLGANPLELEAEKGASYTEADDPGATAVDEEDGDLTDQIVTTGLPIDVGVPGSYTITYSVSDKEGAEGKAEREVIIKDTIAPEVTLNGDAAVTIAYGCSASYTDAGATAVDNIDGDLTPVMSGQVGDGDMAQPTVYTIVWTAVDSSNNEGKATREVTVDKCQNVNPITGACEDVCD